jgi:hypothetical protein
MPTEQATSARVGVDIKPSPVTEAPSVDITPTRIKPSALSEFADKVVPTLSSLAARAETQEQQDLVMDIYMPWANENHLQFSTGKEEGSWTRPTYAKWRADRRLQLFKRAADMKLGPEQRKELFAMGDKALTEEFYLDRVKRMNAPGGFVTNIVDDDIQQGDLFDADALFLERYMQVAKTNPATIAMWVAAEQGLNSDGTPSKHPEIQKQVSRELLFGHIQVEAQLEQMNLDTKVITAALDRDKKSQERVQFEANKIKTNVGTAYRQQAALTLQSVLVEDGGKWRNMPPAAAKGELRRRLLSIRNSDVYQIWESNSGDTEYLTKQMDQVAAVADALFEGLNQLNLEKYTEEQQMTFMKTIAHQSIIDAGPGAIATFVNAENMLHMLQSVVAAGAVDVQGLGDQNPAGALFRAMQTQSNVNTVRGRLIQLDAKQTPDIGQDIGALVDIVGSDMIGVFSSDPAKQGGTTPFGVYSMIQEIKSSSGVDRWLKDETVPVQQRQDFVKLINFWERELISKGKFNPDVLEDKFRKAWKPSEIFSSGVVPMAEAPMKTSEQPVIPPINKE